MQTIENIDSGNGSTAGRNNGRVSSFASNAVSHSPTILQRIAGADASAASDCVETYGGLIWALAKKFTNTPEEAEEAVADIFKEIWRRAADYDAAKGKEEKYVLLAATRHLLRQSLARH